MKDFIQNFKGQLEDINIEINADTNYVNSDFWDSLTAMVVKVMIEDEYKKDIPIERINEFKSINELYEFISQD